MENDEAEDKALVALENLMTSKGDLLAGIEREFHDLKAFNDNVGLSIQGKEREIQAVSAETALVRDQTKSCRRVVDESLLAAEGIQKQLDDMRDKRKQLNLVEMESRSNQGNIQTLKEELMVALSVGSGWKPDQEEAKLNLEKERDFIANKAESKEMELKLVRAEVDNAVRTLQECEKDVGKLDEKIASSLEETVTFNDQMNKLISERDEASKRVNDIRARILQAETDLSERSRIQKGEDRDLHVLDMALKASKELMDEYIRKYDMLFQKLQETTSELERTKHLCAKTKEEIEEREVYNEQRKADGDQVQKESKKIQQLAEVVVQKLSEVDKEKIVLEVKKEELESKANEIESIDCRAIRKEIESFEKVESSVKADIAILSKKHNSSEKTSKTMLDLIQANMNGVKNLNLEKKIISDEVHRERAQIEVLVQEKEKYEHEGEIFNQQYYTALEELKLQELQIKELQKKITDDQGKLKQKQNLYDAVRSDRNLYSKQLVEYQEEITLMKRKFRTLGQYIEQLKEEISTKDHAIVKEHFHHHSVDKDKELLKNEITKIRKQVDGSETIVENQQVELLKLSRIIDEADVEKRRQVNELEGVISERNLLTSQVVKRNYELTQLYEKIKIARASLHIGERNFNQINDSIRNWQEQLRLLVTEQNVTISGLKGVDEMRRKIVALEKAILTESVKGKALLEELDRPMNVHRWRVLESSDPQRFDRIQQIHDLQRQMMKKSDEVVQGDLLVQEKEKVYMELRNIISRQPGPEVDDQIFDYQQTYKEKSKQLRSMNDELAMYREQVDRFKEDIVNVDTSMTLLKKQWFRLRKKQEAKQI
jgi:chromosome segregation ATPase